MVIFLKLLLVCLVLTIALGLFMGGFWLLVRWTVRRRYRFSLDNMPRALAAHRAAILDLAQPCVRLRSDRVGKEESDDPLRSKFGGVPFLESPEDWPMTSDGVAMAFVAQINLEHVAGAIEAAGGTIPPELPRRGMLQCFATFWQPEACKSADPDREDRWRARWIPSPGQPAAPAELSECRGSPALRWLSPRLGWSLPDLEDLTAAPAFLRGDRAAREAYWKLLMGLHGPESNHHLLGYARWLQGDHRARAGHDGHPTDDDPASWRLLWQIEDEDAVDLGDAGVLNILIHTDDLHAGRLDQVRTFNDQA